MMDNTSHPAWGAWIEMSVLAYRAAPPFGRTPHGVRGLKYIVKDPRHAAAESHPAWGAWIEM